MITCISGAKNITMKNYSQLYCRCTVPLTVYPIWCIPKKNLSIKNKSSIWFFGRDSVFLFLRCFFCFLLHLLSFLRFLRRSSSLSSDKKEMLPCVTMQRTAGHFNGYLSFVLKYNATAELKGLCQLSQWRHKVLFFFRLALWCFWFCANDELDCWKGFYRWN